MRVLSFLILALSLASARLSAEESRLSPPSGAIRDSKAKLGLNDVSILLPYQKFPGLFQQAPKLNEIPNPELFAAGLPAAELDGQAFVSADILLKIDRTLQDDNKNLDELSVFFRMTPQNFFEYRLAGIRFDPCANQLEVGKDESKCRHEFRLVWQQRDVKRNRFLDNNIHAIHQMTSEQFQEIVASLRQLKSQAKTDTLAMALQPNPTIVEEGLESSYYKGIIGLVHRYVRASNLIEVAFLAETNQSGHWPMLKLKANDGEFSAITIPGTETKENGSSFFVQRMDGRSTLDDPIPLGNGKDNLFTAVDDKAKFANAFRIENPLKHSAHETDCAGCHRASLEKLEALEKNPALKAPKDAYRSKSQSNWNLQALFPKSNEQSLQLFSYFLNAAEISPRTINESAEVADFINSHD